MSYGHGFFFYLMLVLILLNSNGLHSDLSDKCMLSARGNESSITTVRPEEAYFNHRKLLVHDTCTNRDISISQSRYSSSGIPKFIVQIVNTCVFGCVPSNIHLHCGWFASASIVNPRRFKRLSYDDCLVNGGRPLNTSQIIRFTYSNSFMYSIVFKSAKFC